MQSESVILSTGEALGTCHLLNSKMVKFWGWAFLALVPRALFPLSPRARPNPVAQRHCSISVTFDGPGLKQISIPLVDFKHCLNNDASQGWVNEARSGLAKSDFKINLIRSSDIISTPPSSPFFCSLAPCLCLFIPYFHLTFWHIPLFNFFSSILIFSSSPPQLYSSFSLLFPSLPGEWALT